MNKIKRLFRMHRIFVTQEIKRMMEYKGDFLIGILGFLVNQFFNILFIWIIFSQIPNLLGWSLEQIIFIYGFSLIPKGIDHLFFDNLWSVGYFIVRKGDFDKYLTRPINSYFHILVEKLQIDALGELIMGIILVSITIPTVNIQWSFVKVLLALASIFFATFIYVGIKTITASLAFWIKQSGHVINMFYMMNDFSKYPVSIYNAGVKFIITYIVPFAFTAYYPALYILTGANPLFNIGGSVVMSVILMTIGIIIWNKGVSSYESAGS